MTYNEIGGGGLVTAGVSQISVVIPISCVCNWWHYENVHTIHCGGTADVSGNSLNLSGGIQISGSAEIATNQIYEGLRAWYRLNEQYDDGDIVVDEVSGLHGYAVGSTELGTGFRCQNYSKFDGSQFLVLPQDNLDNFTISMWVRINPEEKRNERGIYTRGNGTEGNEYVFGIYRNILPGFSAELILEDDTIVAVFSMGQITERWYFLQITKDSEHLRIYVDGQLADEAEITGTPKAITSDSFIGRRDTGATWEGDIANVRIWSDPHDADWLAAEYASQGCNGSWAVIPIS